MRGSANSTCDFRSRRGLPRLRPQSKTGQGLGQSASLRGGPLARASLWADAVRDDDPPGFLLLPHGHHMLRRRGQRLRAGGAI